MTAWRSARERSSNDRLLTPDELEAELRAIGAVRYHHLHPFHKLLHGGKLTQPAGPGLGAQPLLLPGDDPDQGRACADASCRRRSCAANGAAASSTMTATRQGTGGIERWLKLAEGVGLDRAYVQSTEGILPGTRFAVEAYVNFVRDRPILEGIASSLTEMFSPGIIADRVQRHAGRTTPSSPRRRWPISRRG